MGALSGITTDNLGNVSERLPFFVYGTLRTGEYNWEIYLKGRTSQEIPARLPGHRMYGATYPYVLEADPNYTIVGNLAYPDPARYDEILADVDGLEGFDPQTHTGLWLRVIRQAEYTDETGQTRQVRAWVYHGNPALLHETEAFYPIETGDWLDHHSHLTHNTA